MNQYRPMPTITSAVKILIIINVLMFVATKIVGPSFLDALALYLPNSKNWAIYQYVTYMFLHGSIGHLFFNMFAVFMFGRVLENVWGTRRFLFYYFVTGIGAALLNSFIGWLEVRSLLTDYQAFLNSPSPDLLSEAIRDNLSRPAEWVWDVVDKWINNPTSPELIAQGKQMYAQIIDLSLNTPMIGASGAVFGILLAFGMLFPNTELYLMFIPIPIKAKYFVFGYGVIELMLGFQNNPADNIAHFAHIGGMLFGFIILMIWRKKKNNFY